MTGQIVYHVETPHRCSGLPFAFDHRGGQRLGFGTRWQCHDCGAIWELMPDEFPDIWVRQARHAERDT